mmetsp:Transcript_38074/g.68897  ORF Transcript_38074/g.68897 Transcript_38074/m.68897 type:complete len:93 (+) Transcript_38074:1-279(+)
MDWYGKTPLALAGVEAREVMAALVGVQARTQSSDSWKGLREKCVMKPSAVHLANIERCNKASQEHGVNQGDICSDFDNQLKPEPEQGGRSRL